MQNAALPCLPFRSVIPMLHPADRRSLCLAWDQDSMVSRLFQPPPPHLLCPRPPPTLPICSARHWGFLWKALALHSANLAATLAARPLQPLHDRLQRQLAATVAVKEACRQLGVEGLQELQDLLNCIILSEHVYKVCVGE